MFAFKVSTVFSLLILLFLKYNNLVEGKGKVIFMDIKNTVVNYHNPSFVLNITCISRTYTSNPLHFVTLSFTLLKPIDFTTKVDFYTYEYITTTNAYIKSIDIHLKWCDFIFDQSVFANVLKRKYIKGASVCPLLPGTYSFENMSAPYGRYLKNFPFQQGRVYINVTAQNELISRSRMDLQLKEMAADKFYKYND